MTAEKNVRPPAPAHVCHATHMMELAFPSGSFEKGGPDAKKAGEILEIIRNHTGKRPFALSFPVARLGHTGTRWRVWGELAMLRHMQNVLEEELMDEGILVSHPMGFSTEGETGVLWQRKQSATHRGPAYARRQEKRHNGPVPARPVAPPGIETGTVSLLTASHTPGHQGQVCEVRIQASGRPAPAKGWTGTVNAFGFGAGPNPLVLPDETHTGVVHWHKA